MEDFNTLANTDAAREALSRARGPQRAVMTGLWSPIDRRWLHDVRDEVPARVLAQELAREVGRALRERPLTMVRIFLRPPQ